MVQSDYEAPVVYVALMIEGAECWRPAPAEQIGENIFRLLTPEDYSPDHEQWEFEPGSIVRCANTELEDGEYLVAVERIRAA